MRNPGLDCLRGLAILLVIGNHLGIRIGLADTALANVLPHWLLMALNYNGGEGVTIFFVLSGFLIATRVMQRCGSLDNIQAVPFIFHRGARILPCLLGLLAVIGILDWMGFKDYSFTKPGQSFLGASTAALGLYFNVWQANHGWSVAGITVLWSLSIEELFYLGFPSLCRVPKRILVGLLALLAVIAPLYHSQLHGNEIWREQATLTGFGTIAMGVLAAIIGSSLQPSRSVSIMIGTGGTCLMLAEILAPAAWWHAVGDTMFAMLIMGTAMRVLACHWLPMVGGVGSWWLRRMGQLSYEIYLTHMFVVMAAVRLFRANDLPLAQGWMVYPICLVLIWLLGEAIFRLFSRPVAAFLDQHFVRLRKSDAGPVSV